MGSETRTGPGPGGLAGLLAASASALALLAALATLLVVLASARAISVAKADTIAVRILRPVRAHATVYRWRAVLGPRSIVAEPGPGPLQGGRTRIQGQAGGLVLLTPQARRRVGRRAYMFWEDLEPQAMLPHPVVLLLLDARSGRVLRRRPIAWWPVVDGRPNATSASARPGHRGAIVLSAASRPRVPAAPTARAAATVPSRVIEIGGFGASDAIPDFKAISTWALQTTGQVPFRAQNLGGLEYAINTAYADGARDVVIYVSGHQFVPHGFIDVLGRAGDFVAHLFAGKPLGPYVSLASSPGFGHSWKQQILTAEELKGAIAAVKQRFPDLKTTVVVETCGSGDFGPVLQGTADQVLTSVDAAHFTLAPPRDGSGPSPFTRAFVEDTAAALMLNPSLTLGQAIGAAAPAIGRNTEALAAQQDGGLYPQEPTYTTEGVSGQILNGTTPCNPGYAFLQRENPLYCQPPAGKIAVEVALGFSLGEGASGTVTISPPGQVVDSNTPPPAVANPALGDVFFYSTAGTTVTLTANHGPNSYFDGWQVNNGGRCVPPDGIPSGPAGGGSPGGCSFTVDDRYGLRTFSYQGFAFFGTCPAPGKYLGLRQGELVDGPGVTRGP